MTSSWLFVFGSVLLSRLPLLFQDGRVRTRTILIALCIQELTLLVFEPNSFGGGLAASWAVLAMVWWWLEKSEKSDRGRTGKRLFLLICYMLVTGMLCSSGMRLLFRPTLPSVWMTLQNWFVPAEMISPADWWNFGLYSVGALLCLSEGNLLVRYIIQRLDLRPKAASVIADAAGPAQRAVEAPPSNPPAIDPTEYNRGRVIGLLERLVMFVLVLLGEFSAIGFLIAAKAMARFKQLEEQNFAEYFLVGTLASLATAGALALAVQWFLAQHAAEWTIELLDWNRIQ